VPEDKRGNLKHGVGCPHCFNTGYRGRIGVFELLEVNRDMANALRDNSVRAFNAAAFKSEGYRPLSHSALIYALQGITTLEEVMRVTAQVEDEATDELGDETSLMAES
jgi:MSHA biogenesis protein MshE